MAGVPDARGYMVGNTEYLYADVKLRRKHDREQEIARIWQLIESGLLIPLDEYEIVDYIQAKSNANKEVRVNTGLYLGPDLETYADVSFDSLSNDNYMGREGASGKAVRNDFGVLPNDGAPVFYFGFGNQNLFIDNADTKRHKFFIDVPGLRYGIDGTEYEKEEFSYGNNYSSYAIYIFGVYNQGAVNAYSTVYCEWFYNQGALCAFFVPVKRRSDNRAGFYDVIRKGFYTNAGSGSLIAGPSRKIGVSSGAVPVKKTSAVDAYTARFNSDGVVDGYLYLTDAHIYYKSVTEEIQQSLFLALQKAYNSTPADFFVDGGDHLQGGNNDIVPGGPSVEQACGQLGYISGVLSKLFSKWYPVQGNHDTNYKNTRLSGQTQVNLRFRKYGRMYYDFVENGTHYYVFDTGLDTGISERSTYKTTQLNWFVERLQENAADEHIVIIGHIFTVSASTAVDTSQMTILMKDALATAAAFNARNAAFSLPWAATTTVDFSGAVGTVHYALCGHAHADLFGMYEGIPVLITTRGLYGMTEPTFDLMAYVRSTDTLYAERVGHGGSRILHCAQVTVDGSGELTPELEGELTWASLDENVATVSGGAVTGVTSGYALITAADEAGRAECWVVAVS